MKTAGAGTTTRRTMLGVLAAGAAGALAAVLKGTREKDRGAQDPDRAGTGWRTLTRDEAAAEIQSCQRLWTAQTPAETVRYAKEAHAEYARLCPKAAARWVRRNGWPLGDGRRFRQGGVLHCMIGRMIADLEQRLVDEGSCRVMAVPVRSRVAFSGYGRLAAPVRNPAGRNLWHSTHTLAWVPPARG